MSNTWDDVIAADGPPDRVGRSLQALADEHHGRGVDMALDLLAGGDFEVEDLITHRFGLDGVGEALRLAKTHDESLRAMVYPHGIGVEVKAI